MAAIIPAPKSRVAGAPIIARGFCGSPHSPFSTVILPLGSSVTARAAAMSSTPDWRSASFEVRLADRIAFPDRMAGFAVARQFDRFAFDQSRETGGARDQPRQHPMQRDQQRRRGQRAP